MQFVTVAPRLPLLHQFSVLQMEIKLDYIGARDIARKACLRSACFLGFGLNSARDDRLQDFSLSKEINLQFLPSNLPVQKIDEFKGEFEKWIVSNGLRELIEGFTIFLDRIFECSLLASKNKKKLDESVGATIRKIKNKGLPGKQRALREHFDIKSDFSKHLKTIYEARNCLAHAQGVVTDGYFNDGETLKITWRVCEILVVREDGSEEVIEMKQGTEPIPGPGTIAKRTVTRERVFCRGDQVHLSVKDLAEICIFAYLGCDSFFFQAIEFAQKNGVSEENNEAEPDAPGQHR